RARGARGAAVPRGGASKRRREFASGHHGDNFAPSLRLTMLRPGLHQLPALLEQIATAGSRFPPIPGPMRQSHLGNLVRKAGALGGPIAKARSEAVCRQITPAHALKYL